MSDNQDTQRSEADAELEREIRKERKFTLEEAIGRLIGPGGMKGASPVTRMQQAEVEIGSYLRTHLADAGGALEVVLHRRVKGSELLLNNFDQPLVVLAAYCQRILDSDFLLKEVVRDADVEWGRVMGERPYFEKEGFSVPPRRSLYDRVRPRRSFRTAQTTGGGRAIDNHHLKVHVEENDRHQTLTLRRCADGLWALLADEQ